MESRYRFALHGMMPLLMHNDDVAASDSLSAWRKDPVNKNVSVAGDDRSPAWTWHTYCYHDGTHLAMPSANIAVCLRQAGTNLILKKQKTFKELTQSGMLIDTEYCEFLCGGKQFAVDDLKQVEDRSFTEQCTAVRELGFRLFTKRARVGSSKHIRVRPRFDNWEVRGTLTVFVPELSLDVLTQIFNLAGRVGLCDWRPGCKTPGPFGMFSSTIERA